MDSEDVRVVLKNLDRRLARVEQHLPSLPTRDEMHAAIREEGERTRRHFDVVAESLRDDIRLIAEGHIDLERRVADRHLALEQADARLDASVTRLESSRRRGR